MTKPTMSLSQFKAQEQQRLEDKRNGVLKVGCDTCGEPLVDSDPGSSLMSVPPQIRVHCPACKWSGYAPASVRKL